MARATQAAAEACANRHRASQGPTDVLIRRLPGRISGSASGLRPSAGRGAAVVHRDPSRGETTGMRRLASLPLLSAATAAAFAGPAAAQAATVDVQPSAARGA